MSEVQSVHSKLPPSGAFRWTECTASVKFIEENASVLPPDTSIYADEGTRAHAVLTARLKHTLGQVAESPEMDAIINNLVKFIEGLMRPGDTLLVDRRIPLFYLPEDGGTLDVAIIGNGRIVILDLKYGVGVSVYAEKNKQTAIYAESQIRELELIEAFGDDTPLRLIIYQPRDRSNSDVVRDWRLTRRELAAFCADIESKAKVVLSGMNLEFKPGEACKFCRATGICKAYAARGLVALSDEPVDVVISSRRTLTQLTSPEALTREQRQKVLASKSTLIAWLEAVENQEGADLLSGGKPDKFKLVEGKSNRVWSDPKGAATLLAGHLTHDQIFPPVTPELISPAQAEKLLKATHHEISESEKTTFTACWSKPEGKPTLVGIHDPRPALVFDKLAGLTNLDTDITDLI